MKTPEEKIERRAKDTPKSMRELYIRATSGKCSAKQSIKANCHECMGWNREEVKKCDSAACPLYRHRPYQPKVKKPLKYRNG